MNGDKIQLDYSFWWFYIVKEISPILINNIAFFQVYSYTTRYLWQGKQLQWIIIY